MSQEQAKREEPAQSEPTKYAEFDEPTKYGDVFQVSGELASKPIASQDAAMMQTAEATVLGKTQKGGPATIMQSAATRNERTGAVAHTDVTDIAGVQGVAVSETDIPGLRIVTESIAGHVVGQFSSPTPIPLTSPTGPLDRKAITIGEALEVTAITAADKTVDQSDAAAIQAAEVRATGSSIISPTGVAAAAQSAASVNERMTHDETKVKLGEVLADAVLKLPADKVVTIEDVEGIMGAELRNNPEMTTSPGGVADTIASAAMMNQARIN